MGQFVLSSDGNNYNPQEKDVSVDDEIKIDKFPSGSFTGFKENTLYCFNYHLKGELCNKCISKQMCETEQKRLKFYYSEIKKMAEDSMSLKNILSNKLDYK